MDNTYHDHQKNYLIKVGAKFFFFFYINKVERKKEISTFIHIFFYGAQKIINFIIRGSYVIEFKKKICKFILRQCALIMMTTHINYYVVIIFIIIITYFTYDEFHLSLIYLG